MTTCSLLTVPDELGQVEPYLPTGNEFVSLPTLSPRDAAIYGMNVLSLRARGLLEFRGAPLFAPIVEIGAPPLVSQKNHVSRLDDWLPQFAWLYDDARLTLTLFAPPGQRGWVYRFEFTNGARAQTIRLGIKLNWRETALTIFSTRIVHDVRYAAWDRWTRAFVCESVSAQASAAFAVGADTEIQLQGTADIPGMEGNAELLKSFVVAPHERVTLTFFIAVGAERDGARTTVMDLRRQGAEKLFAETRNWLTHHAPRTTHPVSRLNLLFSYFFSTGTTIDTEELVLVTSRSPLYYVSAAMWARDALLWSFPGILAIDPAKAREVLLAAFECYLKHPGEHAQYIDGAILYPGFELDQLCAYALALHRYWRATRDPSILNEPAIVCGNEKIFQVLMTQKHPHVDLFATFLLATDDPAPLPYVTYANALVCVALEALAEMCGENKTRRANARLSASVLRKLGGRVRAAIYKHCVVQTPMGKMFAGAVDLQGNHVLFDEPPGSLVVLPHYGFCQNDDPVYRRTVAWIQSRENPFYREYQQTPMVACVHAPFAWTMSAVNQILAAPRTKKSKQLAALLAAMPHDAGLACESVDPATGIVKTGRMMASFAGWLGYALQCAAH
jgi:hypothetical protein